MKSFPVNSFRFDAEWHVAQFNASETVDAGIVGIQFGVELGAAGLVPVERFN